MPTYCLTGLKNKYSPLPISGVIAYPLHVLSAHRTSTTRGQMVADVGKPGMYCGACHTPKSATGSAFSVPEPSCEPLPKSIRSIFIACKLTGDMFWLMAKLSRIGGSILLSIVCACEAVMPRHSVRSMNVILIMIIPWLILNTVVCRCDS